MAKLHHKGRKHQKKRNVGLVYEFLVRHVIDSVLKDDDSTTKSTLNIIKRHFRPGSELYREWRLFNAVVKTQGVDETMANAIVRETRNAVRRYDRVKLDREKSRLIHEINHKLGHDVYNRPIPNYKLLATVQTLFNDWRDTGVPNIERIAEYERQMQQHLIERREHEHDDDHVAAAEHSPGNDALVVKLMTEKLNKRYGSKFNRTQRALLSMYAFDGMSQQVVDKMREIRACTLTALDSYGADINAKGDKFTYKKLTEAREAISNFNVEELDEKTAIARVLKLCELKEELEQNDE